MTDNTFAYQNLAWIIDESDYGLFPLIASFRMQNEVFGHFANADSIAVYNCGEQDDRKYDFFALSRWIDANPGKGAYFVRNFQLLFVEQTDAPNNLFRFNLSRDALLQLRKNIVFCVDRATDDLLDRRAVDFYSCIKMKAEFEDDLPEKSDVPAGYDSGLEIGTDIPIDFTESRGKLLGRAIAFTHQADDMEAEGKYREAMNLLSAALAIREKLLGEDAPDTADTYRQMARVYRKLGDYGRALVNAEQALAVHESTLSKDNLVTAESREALANVYQAMGKYGKALEYYHKTLAIREKVLGTEHPDTATTYNNIAMVYQAMGKYGKALEYFNKALAIREKVLGTEHPDTATTYNNIAGVYRAMGEYGRALEYYNKALAISEKVLGTEHPSTATTYFNLAVLYDEMQDISKAREYASKALDVFANRLGSDHPYTVSTRKFMTYLTDKSDGGGDSSGDKL